MLFGQNVTLAGVHSVMLLQQILWSPKLVIEKKKIFNTSLHPLDLKPRLHETTVEETGLMN